MTVNGANHVLILNLEWSPETTLQAEDRCHRPGQTREVHVHYILRAGTVDDQMWDLVEQKAAAQRAVQDREAQCKSVEEILAEAVLANAKLAVAKAMIEQGFRWKGVSIEDAREQAAAVVEIAIPDTLQGVLVARIDRLQEETRRVLQLASVIGRIFFYRILADISHKEQELDGHLLSLQREEMIRERARFPELEYIFKHQLTQEAVYNGLLKKRRRFYHQQVAESLERLFPERIEEQLGLLAYH